MSEVQTMDKYVEGFYQIIKDSDVVGGTSRFPICKPYQSEDGVYGDKNHVFSTSVWNDFGDSEKNWLSANNYQNRSTKLREDFTDNPITNNEWNALLVKIREEFMIRNNFLSNYGSGSLKPRINNMYIQNGHQGYFATGDTIRQDDISRIFDDILTLLSIEVPSVARSGSSVNNRLPLNTLSSDVAKTIDVAQSDGSYTKVKVEPHNVDFAQLAYNLNAYDINEGSHQGNNWFTGSHMREYVYRHSGIRTEETSSVDGTVNNGIVPTHEPTDLTTSTTYGYAEEPPRNNSTSSQLITHRRPFGNIDYVKLVKDGSLKKPIIDGDGYVVSDEYMEMVHTRWAFLGSVANAGKISPMYVKYIIGTREIVVKDKDGNVMKDTYGNPIKQIETKDFSADANITVPDFCKNPLSITHGEYTLNIAASNVATYFMKVMNLISSKCVCNCNYCSCFGHEAACACYVVKVTGWCYTYQYIL